MFKTIVVPTDGSDCAERAVSVAADVAAKYGANLHIITVMEDVALPDALRRYAEAEHLKGGEARISTAIAERFVEHGQGLAAEAGATSIERSVLMGYPAERILEYAKDAKADLIVIGTRGHSDFESLMLGSVSHKIANLAPCNVVMVR